MTLADDSRAEGSISSEYINIRAQTSIVKKDLGLTTEAGPLKENVKKNRYKDILPHDQTRVPLTLLTNENDYDYINASFIKVIIMACREIEMERNDGYMARKDRGNNTSPVLIHCSLCFLAVAYMFEKALQSAENNYQNLTKSNQPVKTSPPTTSASAQTLAKRNSNVQHRAPQPRQQKMNDTYVVVNKSKQLPPPASSTAPPAALLHYDNADLSDPKYHVSSLYSMVKPNSRCPPANPPPAVSPIYDTAGPANHRLAEASAVEHQSGYELITAECYTSTEDDYEYVSNPIKNMTNSWTPGSMEFNCRIKKPKGPRDPPAEWCRVER